MINNIKDSNFYFNELTKLHTKTLNEMKEQLEKDKERLFKLKKARIDTYYQLTAYLKAFNGVMLHNNQCLKFIDTNPETLRINIVDNVNNSISFGNINIELDNHQQCPKIQSNISIMGKQLSNSYLAIELFMEDFVKFLVKVMKYNL